MKMGMASRVEDVLAVIRKHQGTAPVQVIPMANDLGVKVYYVDWPADMSGRIERTAEYGGASGYAIFVNKNHHPNRRRFTIAHEIAHFALHKEQIGDGVYDDAMYRSGLPHRTEVEANRLAADILMPWHLVSKATREGYSSVSDIAKKFGVSETAMSIRLGVPN